MNEEKLLCPNCKTGADALKLDPNEPMCPYMEFHNSAMSDYVILLNLWCRTL